MICEPHAHDWSGNGAWFNGVRMRGCRHCNALLWEPKGDDYAKMDRTNSLSNGTPPDDGSRR